MAPLPPQPAARPPALEAVPDEAAFGFLPLNRGPAKPRRTGRTEIRGPYYTPVGPTYLGELLDAVGPQVDALKFAGASFLVLPRRHVEALIAVCHDHEVAVSTGGAVEWVLTHGEDAVDRYLRRCRELGFDLVEVSRGFLAVPAEDLAALSRRVREHGMAPRPEVGVQFGAGGASPPPELEGLGLGDPAQALHEARLHIEAGAEHVLLESEGLTENVPRWRTDLVAAFVRGLGLERLVFEAADPAVSAWYVRQYGPAVNLFVDHAQALQLACLRAGVWGPHALWGRVRTYRPQGPPPG